MKRIILLLSLCVGCAHHDYNHKSSKPSDFEKALNAPTPSKTVSHKRYRWAIGTVVSAHYVEDDGTIAAASQVETVK